MKKLYIICILVFFIALAGLYFFSKSDNINQFLDEDYKNTTYIIEGKSVILSNGYFEAPVVSDSASKTITRYFGNEVFHDLNNDGQEDVVFLLTQETGGSGVFFYVVAALRTETGYKGSHAFLLGDRIAPQSTMMDEGVTSQGTLRQNVVVVNYAVRLPNEPFTAKPSLGKSMWLKLDPTSMQFGEVAQDFTGEAR